MAWIEVHQSLPRHTRLLTLAAASGYSRHEALGHLICLWLWALDAATPEGLLPDLCDAATLAEGSEVPTGRARRWTEALLTSGLIKSEPGGYCLHDWPDYGGQWAARREANRERQRRHREATCHATVTRDLTTDVTPLSRVTTPLRHGATGPNSTEPNSTVPPDPPAANAAVPPVAGGSSPPSAAAGPAEQVRHDDTSRVDIPAPDNDPATHAVDIRVQALLPECRQLPGWSPRDDVAWLQAFASEFPALEISHLRGCRDWHEGKRHGPGQWRSRLRQWMAHVRPDDGHDELEDASALAERQRQQDLFQRILADLKDELRAEGKADSLNQGQLLAEVHRRMAAAKEGVPCQ